MAQAAIAGPVMPHVVVTVEALKPYVDEIMKGVGSSVSLVKPDQSPHTMVLSPSEAQALANADVIIMPDRSMSTSLMRVLGERKRAGAIVVELSALPGAEPLPYPSDNPWLQARKEASKKEADRQTANGIVKDDDDDEGAAPKDNALDPHLWLDPLRMAAIAQPLADMLAQASPHYARTYSYNAVKLATHLRRDVDPALRTILSRQQSRLRLANQRTLPFITYHAAYQYFLARYGIAPEGFITQVPEDYLGARTLRSTLKHADAEPIRCLISENDSPLVRRIAAQSGAQIVSLNPERSYDSEETPNFPWMRNGYDRMLYEVATSFAGCL